MLSETGEHLRATVRAKNLRELAELQAAFAQHRIEMSATHAKELADLARAGSEQAIAPIAGLLRTRPPADRGRRKRQPGTRGRGRITRKGGKMNMALTRSHGALVPQEIDADAYPSVVALFDEAVAALRRQAGLRVLRQADDLRARSTPPRRPSPPGCRPELGVKRGDRIALMCPNVFAFPIAMLGIVRAGAAQVNVNPLYTPRELAHQLNDAGARRSSSSAARPRRWPRSSTRRRSGR